MKNTRKGFTLVELVIVIAVIAILAAVLIPTFGGIIDKSKQNAAMQEARNAYTIYLSEAAEKGVVAEDLWVKIDDNQYVQIVKGVVTAQDSNKGTYIASAAGAGADILEVKDGSITLTCNHAGAEKHGFTK